MSTKTNFKRIALVAVAALGLGVLSSVPSNAAITGTLSVTAANGTATTAVVDSTTAGTISVRWLGTAANDSVLITTALNTKPTLATTSPSINFYPVDTVGSNSAATLFPASRTTNQGINAAQDTAVVNAVSSGYSAGKFKFQLDTTVAIVAGTYSYTLTLTPYTNIGSGSTAESTKAVTQEVTIVVSALTANSTTPASTFSSAVLVSGTTVDSSTADGTSIALAGTASGSASAVAFVKLRNSSNGAVETIDSLTVTIDKGNVGSTSTAAQGKNVIINYAPASPDGGVKVFVFPDGSTGAATITIATKSAGSFTKTLSWYGTDVKSIVAQQRLTVIATGSQSGAVRAQAFDANTVNQGSATALYAYSSDTSVISTYGAACSAAAISSADGLWYADCPLTGVKAGTANITIRDAATLALSTVASNAVSVRVSTGVATSFTLTTDKASYAPGEKGYVIVTVKDAAGLVMPVRTSTATLASGGISTTAQLGAASDTLTATSFATARSSSGSNSPSSNDPIKFYVFYAPSTAGSVTFSALGTSTFSAASQSVATTATITVADSASAALAAVSALAVTVASLKTLITTLTNLVLKIQKKVKA